MKPAWTYNDGGRAAAGYRGTSGDCVTRAIAIATGIPYREVYDALFERARRRWDGILTGAELTRRASPRDGMDPSIYRRYMESLGWTWTPTMAVGSGCRVHLRADELPPGRLVVRLSRHVCAVIDGVVHDNHDPSRNGTRCVYGYWQAP